MDMTVGVYSDRPPRACPRHAGEVAGAALWTEAGVFYDSFGRWLFVEDRDPGPDFAPAPPRELGRMLRSSRGSTNYDATPAGRRVLVPRLAGSSDDVATGDSLRVVLNWLDAVRAKVPPLQ